jgi:LacI family transcriptional regulator
MLLVCNSGDDAARELRHLDVLEEHRVLGVLITPVGTADDPRLDTLVERGIAVVLVDRRSGRRNRCSVAVDDRLGGRLAGTHLIQQGHRRIAFVGGPFSLQQVSDRHAGLTDAVDGNAELRAIPTPNLTVEAGRSAASQLFDRAPAERPTAIFCANDLIALGALQELTTRGIQVPDEVAIVGYDDIDFAAAAAVPLSSIRQPRDQLGRAAAGLLLEEVHDTGHKHRHIIFEPELVVRESSRRRYRYGRDVWPE